jgi:hypothetical protein
MDQTAVAGVSFGAQARGGMPLGVRVANFYEVCCYAHKGGPLLWREHIKNLTVTQGLNDILTKYFTGSSYTAAWYVGLINNASFTALAAGDTSQQINGSNGWIEDTAYSAGVRQTLTLGSASAGSISNTASPASFTMNASGTLNGAFIATTSTQGAGAGGTVLYGEASFSSTQAYASGNVITVTVTLTMVST